MITVTGTQVAAVGGLIAGFIIAAAAGYIRFRPLIKRVLALFEHFADDWSGVADRDGVAGRPGMMLRMRDQETATEAVRAQIGELRVEVRELASIVRGGVLVLPNRDHDQHENTREAG